MPRISQKRWISICGFGVVVATFFAAAAMTGSCVFGTRTNLCEQFGVRCKEGQECAAQQMACIDIGGCGNGVVDRDKGEICDDGNIVDGEVVNGVFVPDSCSQDCMSDQTCGNKQLDTGETCDDGDRNGLPDDGCDNNCQLKAKFCGNGIIDINVIDTTMSEQCDPGSMDSAGCNSNQADIPDKLLTPDLKAGCKFSRCGDGYVNSAAGEQCDSGGMIAMNCNGPLCTTPVCGDNFHNKEVGEDCDIGSDDSRGCNGNNHGQGGTGSCKFPACGDGYTNMSFQPPGSALTETCDAGGDSSTCNGNGNDDAINDSNAKCQPPSCGDGYINKKFTPGNGATDTESCDNKGGGDTPTCNGNNSGQDGPGSCRTPSCGDGYLNMKFRPLGSTLKEACDSSGDSQQCNGNGDGNAKCQIPQCGDGYLNTEFRPPGSTLKEACDTSGDSQTCNGNGDGDAKCQAPRCGDGYVNMSFKPPGSTLKEACDTSGDSETCNGDGNGNDKNNKNAQCQISHCGDGYLNTQAGEECDKGDPPMIPRIACTNGTSLCQNNCKCI